MVNKDITLPEYNEEDYPFTEALLGVYDKATNWMAEASYSHRELFRFACQCLEVKLQNIALSQKIVRQKAHLDELDRQIAEEEARLQELNRQIVILRSIKKGPARG